MLTLKCISGDLKHFQTMFSPFFPFFHWVLAGWVWTLNGKFDYYFFLKPSFRKFRHLLQTLFVLTVIDLCLHRVIRSVNMTLQLHFSMFSFNLEWPFSLFLYMCNKVPSMDCCVTPFQGQKENNKTNPQTSIKPFKENI